MPNHPPTVPFDVSLNLEHLLHQNECLCIDLWCSLYIRITIKVAVNDSELNFHSLRVTKKGNRSHLHARRADRVVNMEGFPKQLLKQEMFWRKDEGKRERREGVERDMRMMIRKRRAGFTVPLFWIAIPASKE